MANSKKIYIRTVTVERYLVAKDAAIPLGIFCKGCGLLTEMLTVGQASSEVGFPMQDLFRLAENGVIHSAETDAGHIMLCRASLHAI